MEPVADGHSIVAVGAWNAAIFTPEWITGRLTQATDVILEVPVNNPGLTPRLRFDEIIVQVRLDRLIIGPHEVRDDLLMRTQEVAIKVLAELPHTPVRAVGVNFQYDESDPSDQLLAPFQLNDQGMLGDAGASIRTTSIKRSLESNDQLVNFTLDLLENGHVNIAFNFHQEAPNADAVRQYLDTGILNLRNQAIALLTAAYEIDQIGD